MKTRLVVALVAAFVMVAGSASATSLWKVIKSPNPGTDGAYVARGLAEVTAASASKVWAAGWSEGSPLLISWDGTAWSRDAVPSPGGGTGGLTAIDTDGQHAWAVGVQNSSPSQWALHLVGSTWTAVPVTGAPSGDYLRDVTVTSDSDVWAVGDEAGGVAAAALHWNGSTWSSVPPPVPSGASGVQLNSVETIRGTSRVIAVGYYVKSGEFFPYAVKWNGSSWTMLTTPTSQGELHSVVVLSASNAWAVGFRSTSTSFTSIIEHWNGSSWSKVRGPHKAAGDTLLGIDANGQTDVWAVGYTGGYRTFIVHYDGAAWSIAPSPNPSTTGVDELFGASYVPGTNRFWAVGEEGPARPGNDAEYTLTERCSPC